MDADQLSVTLLTLLVAVSPVGTVGGVVSGDATLNTAATAYQLTEFAIVNRASCAPARLETMSPSALSPEVERTVKGMPWLVPPATEPSELFAVRAPNTSSPAGTAAVGPESTAVPDPERSDD